MDLDAAVVPFSAPDIGEDEVAAAADAWRSGWVTTGNEAAAFEREFAEFMGNNVEAIALNSATAGLHLALEALGVREGDEVIVPTWTFTATAEVVRYLGATPVLVDVDEHTLNMDLAATVRAISPRTKAVIPVHFAGRSVDVETLRRLTAGMGISIVEDAAHAIPSGRQGARVGDAQHSDAAVFSFYANKTMTTGEGGMVTTRDQGVANRIRTMRLHGINRDVFDRYRSLGSSWRYDVVAPGYKYNLTDPAAAVGRVQLRRVKQMAQRRSILVNLYRAGLTGLPLALPPLEGLDEEHAWHLFVVRLTDDARVSRDEAIQGLAERGVGTSVHFIPLHRLTYWQDSLGVEASDFPVAEDAFKRVISLPLFSGMTLGQAQHVVDAVRQVIGP